MAIVYILLPIITTPGQFLYFVTGAKSRGVRLLAIRAMYNCAGDSIAWCAAEGQSLPGKEALGEGGNEGDFNEQANDCL